MHIPIKHKLLSAGQRNSLNLATITVKVISVLLRDCTKFSAFFVRHNHMLKNNTSRTVAAVSKRQTQTETQNEKNKRLFFQEMVIIPHTQDIVQVSMLVQWWFV